MSLLQLHLNLVSQAAQRLVESDIAPYFALREMLVRNEKHERRLFRKQFAKYYGLNAAGITDTFKTCYFQLLFELKLVPDIPPPYKELLLELYPIKRSKGDNILAASFVSKLIAMHDESRPLFDRHVSHFFGLDVPSAGPVEFRIAGFVANLDTIRGHYLAWSKEHEFRSALAALKNRIPSLASCHDVRICDFLVWTVGRQRIGAPSKPKKRAV
jgi:hypothetical protein